jgi:putative phosphoribosyl transferase
MYFRNRAEAGRKLAEQLAEYRVKNCAVIALSPGAVLVGAQIAMKLHTDLMMLLTGNIVLPGEDTTLAGITSNNTFTYNPKFSEGELDEMRSEYLSVIEAQRIEKLHSLHVMLSDGGEIKRDLLRRRVVILVSDGLSSGFSLDIAAEFLKPVKVSRLVIATPIASVPAIDRMHLVGDEVHCLSTIENYMDTNHYYTDNSIPSMQNILKIMRNTPVNWQIDNTPVLAS